MAALTERQIFESSIRNLERNIATLKSLKYFDEQLLGYVATDSINCWIQAYYYQKDQEILDIVHDCFVEIVNYRRRFYGR